MKSVVLPLLLVLSLAGPGAAQSPITAALADPQRPAADRKADARRKPAETLAFAGVAPGQVVVEFFPGAGYYTRLLSKVVGPKGRVITLPWGEPNSGATVRLAADPAYANITPFLDSPLAFRPGGTVDVVFTTQNYHDITSPQRPQINQVVFKALKPGGVYFILDHAAAAHTGAGAMPLHRIDEALVEKEVTAAGFVLAGRSDILRNPDDDRRTSVFAPAIRGRTDQFLLKFVKPG